MKKWLIVVAMVLLMPWVSWGEEDITGTGEVFLTAPTFYSPVEKTSPYLVFTPATETFTLTIRDDGQLDINGKPVESMSHPELKAILLEIRDALVKQCGNDWCNRQTTYLLEELERCQKQNKGGIQ